MVDHPRILIACAGLLLAGSTLVLSHFRWFARVPLGRRLFAYSSGARQSAQPLTLGDLVRPLATTTGAQIAKLFGLDEDIAHRLRRAHLDIDPSTFRMQQFGWAAGLLGGVLLLLFTLEPPAPIALLAVVGAPLLGFLVLEQKLLSAVSARQQRQFAELPVMTEQLAMLISAGYSLGSALNHLAKPRMGAISEDLHHVCTRTQQGLTIHEALKEWADQARLGEIDRLVAVLSVSSETNDLGRLVSEEARNVRNEAQRRLIETIDRRTEQVWVPVTVATLIPGLIFLAIPFLQALSLFSTG